MLNKLNNVISYAATILVCSSHLLILKYVFLFCCVFCLTFHLFSIARPKKMDVSDENMWVILNNQMYIINTFLLIMLSLYIFVLHVCFCVQESEGDA